MIILHKRWVALSQKQQGHNIITTITSWLLISVLYSFIEQLIAASWFLNLLGGGRTLLIHPAGSFYTGVCHWALFFPLLAAEGVKFPVTCATWRSDRWWWSIILSVQHLWVRVSCLGNYWTFRCTDMHDDDEWWWWWLIMTLVINWFSSTTINRSNFQRYLPGIGGIAESLEGF